MRRYSVFRRFQDLGTGRLPVDSELNNRRYLIMATIGKGGMGAVYLALDTRMSNQQVAIKEMSQANLLDAGALHRARQSFQQEASMLTHLQHPNLPHVYTSFQENGRSYLVMEYIEGKTLAETLKQGRVTPLPVSATVEYGLQLSSVLAYLHTRSQPIIYLDLKPPNIMLRKDGRVFLIDFGIAHFFQAGLTLAAEEVFFTPGYAPPEQMVGQPEPRSDLFALGATLHQCLTRQSPQSHTKEHVFDFPPVQLLNPQAPDDLCLLVERMLSVDQQKRPASASLVQQNLEQIHRQLVNPVVIRSRVVPADPNAPTVQAGYPTVASTPLVPFPSRPGPAASHTNNWARVAQLFPQLAQQGQRLGFSLMQKPWQQARAIVSNQKIWDQRFAAILLSILVLALGGSLAFLKAAPDAPHIHILGLFLILTVLGIIGFHLSGKRLDDPVPRALLGLMGLVLAFASLILQGLPDMEAIVQPLVQHATLNQIGMVGLLASAVLCLTRPEKSLAWVDHLLLGALAVGGALWQYGFGQDELAQFPALAPGLSRNLNTGLIWGLLAIALLAFLLLRRPFHNWSRFWLVLVASIFTAFQYASGFNEFQAFHMTGTPLIVLSFAYTWIPILCALLAWFTRRAWLTRVALCTLALAEATMLNYQGQDVFFSFLPATPYPLSLNVLASPTFYHMLGPILVLVALLTLLLLPGKSGFRWLDHGLLLVGAFFCARLDQAFWQTQSELSATTIDQTTMHQQYIVLAGLLPAYLISWLLWAFPLILGAIIACHFWQQSNPYARVDPWLKRFQAILTLIDRLLALALLLIAALLLSSLGILSLLSHLITTRSLAGQQLTPLLFLTLPLLVLLATLAIVLLVRLLRRKTYELGKSERLVLFFATCACLLFLWQDPTTASLPLLHQHIQFVGNIFDWSPAVLSLALLGTLVLIPCLAFFWLRRSFFASYRALLNLLFFLVLVCAFLQLSWPIFLPLGMLCLIPGVLLAVQIEKVG